MEFITKVAGGETLYRISVAYKVPIATLMKVNRLSSAAALKRGSGSLFRAPGHPCPLRPMLPFPSRKRKTWKRPWRRRKSRSRPGDPEGYNHGLSHPGRVRNSISSGPFREGSTPPSGRGGKKTTPGSTIDSPSYQEVKAAMDGEVILARYSRTGYGNVVVLRHDSGYSTIYGHMNVIIAKEGDGVRQGEAVGGVGSTGRSTGPHLHFEVRHEGRPIDPLPLLPMTIDDLIKKAAHPK